MPAICTAIGPGSPSWLARREVFNEQKAKIVGDIEKLNASAGWTKMLADKGWTNTYLAGADFSAQLDKDIAATETVLRDIGLVK